MIATIIPHDTVYGMHHPQITGSSYRQFDMVPFINQTILQLVELFNLSDVLAEILAVPVFLCQIPQCITLLYDQSDIGLTTVSTLNG